MTCSEQCAPHDTRERCTKTRMRHCEHRVYKTAAGAEQKQPMNVTRRAAGSGSLEIPGLRAGSDLDIVTGLRSILSVVEEESDGNPILKPGTTSTLQAAGFKRCLKKCDTVKR